MSMKLRDISRSGMAGNFRFTGAIELIVTDKLSQALADECERQFENCRDTAVSFIVWLKALRWTQNFLYCRADHLWCSGNVEVARGCAYSGRNIYAFGDRSAARLQGNQSGRHYQGLSRT